MTTGLVIEPFTQWRSCCPVSTTSAFDFRSSTVARRTVQTLIGSYVAFRTSTRPPLQRPEPSGVDPCRWWSTGGTDPDGAGGTAGGLKVGGGETPRGRAPPAGGKQAQTPPLFALPP